MIHRILIAVALLVSAPASSQDRPRPDDELVILQNRLMQMRGVSVELGGINFADAMRIIVDRTLDLERRIEQIERNAPKRK